MAKTVSFKRLILRAVLRQVSPMVICLVSFSDHMPLREFHDVFRIILGWNGDLGYIIRVHGQEFNSFRRKTRSKALHVCSSRLRLRLRLWLYLRLWLRERLLEHLRHHAPD